jgi:hypothetical protein
MRRTPASFQEIPAALEFHKSTGRAIQILDSQGGVVPRIIVPCRVNDRGHGEKSVDKDECHP